MGTSPGQIAVVTVVSAAAVGLFYLWATNFTKMDKDEVILSAYGPILKGGSKRRKRGYKNRKSKKRSKK